MTSVTIYHNPGCSKSRGALEILNERGVEHEVVEYLAKPPDRATLERLLETRVFAVQDRDLVRRALEQYREGPGDFADYLLGWQNRAAGCDDTVTFDANLATAPGFASLD